MCKLLLIGISLLCAVNAKVLHKVRCSPSSMRVEISKTEDVQQIYLDQLKGYPKCQPTESQGLAVFTLPLDDSFYLCGTTRVVNKVSGAVVFYHRVVVEYKDATATKEVVMVKFDMGRNGNLTKSLKGDRNKRELLPAGFQEPEVIEITSEITEIAPTPELAMTVKQSGRIVGTELTVQPGTPLTMEINIDRTSASIYGLLASYMEVSDTKNQEEVIVAKGCSVDTYLFENFRTLNGDVLTARFRAFKFPESTYVLFRGVVNVCLDSCIPKQCSNGDLAFGRKKRAIPSPKSDDPNMLFEVTMTTYIKVQYDKEIPLMKGSLAGFHNEAPNLGQAIIEPIGGHRTLQYTEYSGSYAMCSSIVTVSTALLLWLLLL